ncbi:tyrosine-type recombinase/integrase [Anaerotignum propionicum]|uniref:Integrase/recombinase XerD n=1 Tax=Anaerotignum propionicum DSM 1682 TaxID=991789 RepID=A0A110A7K2_ANAPI|nr:tyrosine-type recombinase/integrase [Anaerotignum propionicum]AMJ42350.1 tyrosine recombinase XerD [Anaerotignum propionicum DSM 1682]SHF00175.1 integrase/recombinase XerD [[Clostridium] propionicum DSM 1682] [Anaerotignum propionicum DSM 1682]
MKKISLNQNEPITMSECFEQYIVRCKVRNLSEKTLDIYRVHFSVLEKYSIAADWSLSTINLLKIDGFILYLRERGCNDITVQSYLRDLRAFFYFCMDNEWIPQFKIKLPKADKKIKETYTDEELKVLLKKPNLKNTDFTEYKTWVYSNYLLATGNRISSALDIKIRDLDFNNQLIQMNTSKNRKAQIIPMSDSLAVILKEYLNYRKGTSDDYLFCNSFGGKSDLRTYQEMLVKYNRSRGVIKTSSHLYRHTFAKKWILNGGDIFRLQKLLGHSDLTVVKEYVNMFSKDLSLNYSQFNPLDTLEINQNKTRIHIESKRR